MDVPTIQFYPNPELKARDIHGPLNICSILNVGSSEGVFDHMYWTNRIMHFRVACDKDKIRNCGQEWAHPEGVHYDRLSKEFSAKSFDMVQATEYSIVRKEVEQMCIVASKLVFITAKDVSEEGLSILREFNFNVCRDVVEKRMFIAWRVI